MNNTYLDILPVVKWCFKDDKTVAVLCRGISILDYTLIESSDEKVICELSENASNMKLENYQKLLEYENRINAADQLISELKNWE